MNTLAMYFEHFRYQMGMQVLMHIRFVIYNALSALTVLSLLAASTRSPGTPDPTLAPDGINHSRAALEKNEDPSPGYRPDAGADEDDIPLRYLRNTQWVHTRGGKDRPSPLPLAAHSGRRNPSSPRPTPSDGGFHMPSISPFPLNNSPFVPTSPTDAGEDTETSTPSSSTLERDTPTRVSGEEQDELGERDDEMLLPKRNVIMGKSSNGAPRWCKKCDQWKPDRCHHCRFCKRCTLKSEFGLSRTRFGADQSGFSGPSLRLDRDMCRFPKL